MILPDKMTNKASRLLKWAKIQAEWTFAPTADEILALDETRLLDDPLWTNAPNETEAAFAAKLMATHSPEQIAAACLRLYRAGLSAPEDLGAPAAPGARPERQAFGPSVWFALSVGRAQRAEARWLLPLLCRAGNLDKAGEHRPVSEVDAVEIADRQRHRSSGPYGCPPQHLHIVKFQLPSKGLKFSEFFASPLHFTTATAGLRRNHG